MSTIHSKLSTLPSSIVFKTPTFVTYNNIFILLPFQIAKSFLSKDKEYTILFMGDYMVITISETEFHIIEKAHKHDYKFERIFD